MVQNDRRHQGVGDPCYIYNIMYIMYIMEKGYRRQERRRKQGGKNDTEVVRVQGKRAGSELFGGRWRQQLKEDYPFLHKSTAFFTSLHKNYRSIGNFWHGKSSSDHTWPGWLSSLPPALLLFQILPADYYQLVIFTVFDGLTLFSSINGDFYEQGSLESC